MLRTLRGGHGGRALRKILLLTSITLGWTTFAAAQAPSGSEANAQKAGEPAPVVFWNRQITVFRSYYENLSPTERANRAVARLESIPEVGSEWLILVNEASSGQYYGAIVTVNGQLAFAILTGDLDRESQETLQLAANNATTQLRSALEARSQQRRWPVFFKALGLSLGATLLFLLGLWLLMRGGRAVLERHDQRASMLPRPLKIAGFDTRPLLLAINRLLIKLSFWSAAVLIAYVWLAFVLLRFPYSQPWGQQLGSFLTNLFQKLGSAFLHSLPGIFTVVVIFLLSRIVVKIVDRFFVGIEEGTLESSWLHADTARATRQIVIVLVWIFAIVVAYPYIPGSSSDAFKGVSVLVGLMVSLGSAGLVNQVMSGLVVIYSRALKPGEFVKIGDDIGTVTDVGMLSTKILTRKKEEITIPNAVLVATTTVNYSRQATDEGAVVGTTVTIGYDAPWRQIHEMLLHAADQTTGVRKDPAPRVWQKALSDFYVEYELVFNLDHPEERVAILSELHKHIQDAFNEQGVQIMSPHFEMQPGEKVYVPKSQWFAKSTSASAKKGGSSE
jgi:small-conductance mechanosensitive channel